MTKAEEKAEEKAIADIKFNDVDYQNCARIWLFKNQDMTDGQIKSHLKVVKKDVQRAKALDKKSLLMIGRALVAERIYY